MAYGFNDDKSKFELPDVGKMYEVGCIVNPNSFAEVSSSSYCNVYVLPELKIAMLDFNIVVTGTSGTSVRANLIGGLPIPEDDIGTVAAVFNFDLTIDCVAQVVLTLDGEGYQRGMVQFGAITRAGNHFGRIWYRYNRLDPDHPIVSSS